MTNKLKFLSAAAVIAAGMSLATPATAGGCNGVVSILEWGCAPWDNNNGPQYRYYKKATKGVARGTPVKTERGQMYALVNGQWVPYVGQMVAAGGGNMVAAGGGNITVSLPPN